jgi:hypothetical protein
VTGGGARTDAAQERRDADHLCPREQEEGGGINSHFSKALYAALGQWLGVVIFQIIRGEPSCPQQRLTMLLTVSHPRITILIEMRRLSMVGPGAEMYLLGVGLGALEEGEEGLDHRVCAHHVRIQDRQHLVPAIQRNQVPSSLERERSQISTSCHGCPLLQPFITQVTVCRTDNVHHWRRTTIPTDAVMLPVRGPPDDHGWPVTAIYKLSLDNPDHYRVIMMTLHLSLSRGGSLGWSALLIAATTQHRSLVERPRGKDPIVNTMTTPGLCLGKDIQAIR